MDRLPADCFKKANPLFWSNGFLLKKKFRWSLPGVFTEKWQLFRRLSICIAIIFCICRFLRLLFRTVIRQADPLGKANRGVFGGCRAHCSGDVLHGRRKAVVNELAPRPHNSGHYTYDACLTSQFEQLIRAVAGLPLGPADR